VRRIRFYAIQKSPRRFPRTEPRRHSLKAESSPHNETAGTLRLTQTDQTATCKLPGLSGTRSDHGAGVQRDIGKKIIKIPHRGVANENKACDFKEGNQRMCFLAPHLDRQH